MIPLVRLGTLALLLLLSASGARAQGVQGFCPSSYEPAAVSAATRYDVKLEDGCKLLVFTSSSAIAVTLPNPATTLPVGWRIGFKAEGAGTLTVSPLAGALIDRGATLIMTTGQGTHVYTNHVDFFSTGVSGGGGGGGVTNVSIVGGPCLTAIPNPIVTTGILELTVPANVGCGGTGDTTLASHTVLIGQGIAPVASATPSSSNGIPLISQGTSADPIFGTAAVIGGGTGQTSYFDGQLLIGNSSGNTLTKATLTAGSGIGIANGNGSITISATGGPGTGTVTSITCGTGLTCAPNPITASGTPSLTIPVAVVNGGTGQTAYTSGQLLIGDSGSGGLDKATLTAGTGISITNGNGSITVANTGSGTGTVTGIGMSVPAEFTVSPMTISTSGVFVIDKANESANTVWAGPTSGGAAPPAFRAVVAADLPACSHTGNYACLNLENSFAMHQKPIPVALTDGATITPLGTDANLYTLTVAGNSHTLACPATVREGTYNFEITNSGGVTGFSVDPSCYLFPGSTPPTWSVTDTAVDVLSCSSFHGGGPLRCNALIGVN